MSGSQINRKFIESATSTTTQKSVEEVALYLTMRLGDRSGRTYELGDATVSDIKVRQFGAEIRLSFKLANEKHHVVREAHWKMAELLAYDRPVTRLLEDELEEAIVDLLIQDEKKVRSILKKASR